MGVKYYVNSFPGCLQIISKTIYRMNTNFSKIDAFNTSSRPIEFREFIFKIFGII